MSNPADQRTTADHAGNAVRAGSAVRVLAVPEKLLAALGMPERERLLSLRRQVLEVLEVDQSGLAWVEQWWSEGEGMSSKHALGLEPAEMAVCAPGTVIDRTAV